MTLPTIIIKFIPHAQQRYNTWGDYWYSDPQTLQVRVTVLEDWRHSFALAIHELFEFGVAVLLHKTRIEDIDAFDKAYRGADPGSNPKAPYHAEHMQATEAEELFYEASGYEG